MVQYNKYDTRNYAETLASGDECWNRAANVASSRFIAKYRKEDLKPLYNWRMTGNEALQIAYREMVRANAAT